MHSCTANQKCGTKPYTGNQKIVLIPPWLAGHSRTLPARTFNLSEDTHGPHPLRGMQSAPSGLQRRTRGFLTNTFRELSSSTWDRLGQLRMLFEDEPANKLTEATQITMTWRVGCRPWRVLHFAETPLIPETCRTPEAASASQTRNVLSLSWGVLPCTRRFSAERFNVLQGATCIARKFSSSNAWCYHCILRLVRAWARSSCYFRGLLPRHRSR